MGFVQKAEHLKRYKDLAWLLVKYGRSDLVTQMGLDVEANGAKVDPADAEKAAELTNDLESLGPTYVKLGQFLSTRADFLPPAYLEALTRLQDKVAPVAYEEVEAIVAAELGVRISKAFDHFDPEPLASASLSQVHAATLRGGRPVAVKVQRPNIRTQIVHDLDAFADVAAFLEAHTEAGRQFMLQASLEEFRKAMLRELDFKQEAQNLVTLKENMAEFELIVVPSPVEDYTTSRVLTMDYIRGKNIGKLTPLGQMEIDGSALAETLFQAYLKQILIDGFYHADPHPGNIFLTDTGRIALIDLGMVAHLSEGLQTDLVRLLLAISEGNGEQAATYTMALGEPIDEVDEPKFREEVTALVSQYQNRTLADIQVGRLVLEVTQISAANGIRLPSAMVMLGKTLLNLDIVGRTLDPTFDPNASLRRNAAALVQQRMQTSPASLYESLLDTKALVENLPGRLNSILDALANDRFTIRTQTIDEQYLMAGLKAMTNRLTLGIILAALIIGAALLMRVQTTFTVFGYPGIAMVFFLLAGIGGLVLAFNILYHDELRRKKK